MDSYKSAGSSHKFWRFIRISEDAFLDQVEVGDLLLCTRKNKYRNKTGNHKIHDVYTVIQL
jgi:hypothetical protein